jgi:hypothetical protein
MNPKQEPAFDEALAAKRAAVQLDRQNQRLAQLVRLIDELSGEMGSSVLREHLRTKGYDIDADTGILARRGVDINN